MKGGTGYFLDADFVYYPRRSDSMAFAANIGWEGISSSKGTISSGAVGWGGGLSLSGKNYSKIESSIWWFSIGVVIFPEKLWQF
jgi:hypothetical protein